MNFAAPKNTKYSQPGQTNYSNSSGQSFIRFGLLVILLLVMIQAPVMAATFNVDQPSYSSDANPGDCICSDGDASPSCSLNAAIDEANACPGTDTINVPAGTYLAKHISIDESVIIEGAGFSTILDTDGTPLFAVNSGATALLGNAKVTGDWQGISNAGDLTLSNVWVTGITPSGFGANNSPIFNGGALTINHSVISGNSADNATDIRGGVIHNAGTLDIFNSTFSSNSSSAGCGGAILNSETFYQETASVTISGSHFSGNSASTGGAICNGYSADAFRTNTISIEQTSFSSNSVTSDGGAIYQNGLGTNSMELVNTTVSGNQANLNGGGIFLFDGTIEIASSTIANNMANADDSGTDTGGGIYILSGQTNLKNTLLADNTRRQYFLGSWTSIASDCIGTIASDGYNLVGSNCSITPAIGDQLGQSKIDPLLGALQTGGFGESMYHPLQPGSPAIDAGNFDGCTDYDSTPILVDQTGTSRIQGFVCDVGSAESAYTAGRIITYPVDTLTTTEAGGGAVVNVRLNGDPTVNVTVGATSSDTSEGTLSSSSVLFEPGESSIRALNLSGVNDDLDDGNINYSVNFSAAVSDDGTFSGIDPDDRSATNIDDDTAGVTVNVNGELHCNETGTTDSFTLVLDSEPTASVDITVTSPDTTEFSVSPGTVTFTAASFSLAQSVTVTCVDDDVADGVYIGHIILSPVTSGDTNYDGLDLSAQYPEAINNDRDVVGITVTETTGAITTEAGGQDTFTAVLDTLPSATVTVPVVSTDLSEGTVSPASLSFTTANWNEPQTVTVTGVDDFVYDGDQPYHIDLGPTASADADYDALSVSVSALNKNDDFPNIYISPASGLHTAEFGHTSLYTVVLGSQPTDTVTIPSIVSNDTTEVTVSPSSMQFTTANWNVPQTVTLTGVDDDVVDGDIGVSILHSNATSSDSDYHDWEIPNVYVINEDDDVVGITVTPTSGLVTTEKGGQDTYTIVLTSQPGSWVYMTGITSDDTSEVTVSPSSMHFTIANWNVPQTVTLTGVDDDVADGDILVQISHPPTGSLDPNYDSRVAARVSVTNEDDDTIYGFVVKPTSGLETTEAGGQDTYTVAITSQPESDVYIPEITSNNTSEVTVSPSELLFTKANWVHPQTVTVTGVDDDIVDGFQIVSISHAPAESLDSDYSGNTPTSVSVVNYDDDGLVECYEGNHTVSGALMTITIQATVDLDTSGVTQVLTGEDVAFWAGNSVTLNPGFEVQKGSAFMVRIAEVNCIE